MPGKRITVRGTVELAGDTSRLGSSATAYVRVWDVSLVDVLAPLAVEQVVPLGDTQSASSRSFPFELSFAPARSADYALEVHVSRDGEREIRPGDFLTMESYPIDTEQPAGGDKDGDGDGTEVRMRVTARQIGWDNS